MLLFHFAREDYAEALLTLIYVIYLEKVAVFLLNHFAHLLDPPGNESVQNLPQHNLIPFGIGDFIDLNIKQTLNEIPNKKFLAQWCTTQAKAVSDDYSILAELPAIIINNQLGKTLTLAVVKQFSSSITGYFISDLRNGRINRNVPIDLGTISYTDAVALEQALRRENCPPVLSLSFNGDNIGTSLSNKIQDAVRKNNLTIPILESITLQQGKEMKNHWFQYYRKKL